MKKQAKLLLKTNLNVEDNKQSKPILIIVSFLMLLNFNLVSAQEENMGNAQEETMDADYQLFSI